MNADLAAAEAYTKLDQKTVTAWGCLSQQSGARTLRRVCGCPSGRDAVRSRRFQRARRDRLPSESFASGREAGPCPPPRLVAAEHSVKGCSTRSSQPNAGQGGLRGLERQSGPRALQSIEVRSPGPGLAPCPSSASPPAPFMPGGVLVRGSSLLGGRGRPERHGSDFSSGDGGACGPTFRSPGRGEMK